MNVRDIERALVSAMEAQPDTIRAETDHHGDKQLSFKDPKWDRGRPIMPRLNLSRIAEIMESELS